MYCRTHVTTDSKYTYYMKNNVPFVMIVIKRGVYLCLNCCWCNKSLFLEHIHDKICNTDTTLYYSVTIILKGIAMVTKTTSHTQDAFWNTKKTVYCLVLSHFTMYIFSIMPIFVKMVKNRNNSFFRYFFIWVCR